MEKYIIMVTYPLGVISVCIAFILRGLNMMGSWLGQSIPTGGSLVDYASFFDGAMLLLLTSIASAAYAWLKVQKF